MTCDRCGHDRGGDLTAMGRILPVIHREADCLANLRADLEAVSSARDDARQRLAALRVPIPEATVSALLDDAARHLDARVRDLERELEAERARSWHGWAMADEWERRFAAWVSGVSLPALLDSWRTRS